MEKIENSFTINKKQYDNLGEELARLLKKYGQSNDVECIYFAPYLNCITNNICILEVRIIVNNRLLRYTNDAKLYNKNQSIPANIKRFGLRVVMDIEDELNFNRNDLSNTTIIYDKVGTYTKMQNEYKKNSEFSYYDNLVTLKPSISF